MRTLRLLYALGPGNVVDSYRNWRDGKDVLSETSRTYSGQFFDFCRRFRHCAYAISSFAHAERIVDGSMIIENRPKRLSGGGFRYHLSQALYAISIMLSAIRWRADAVIVDSGTTHWALLAPLKLAGIKVIASLHNVPWPSGYKPTTLVKRTVLASDAWFWRYIADAVLSVSPECERQVGELAGKLDAVAVQYRPQFNRADFVSILPPPARSSIPFRVLFAGRIEGNKGVFDIVEIARLLQRDSPGRVQFDICGSGSALPALNDSIERNGLTGVVRTHGKLLRPALLKMYAACHAVIVPTRSDFCEGMPMVCAEAILCHRPIITSRLSNAVDVLPGALAIATPDDPRSYADAIRRIVDDNAYYEGLSNACSTLQDQFYDERTSLTAALEKVFSTRLG
jgi:glycogen synthase